MLTSCEQKGSSYNFLQPADRADGWEIEDLSEVGINPAKLGSMMNDIEDGGYENLHSILMVKNGKLVFEEYFQGYGWYTKQSVASVTKSVISAMVGAVFVFPFNYWLARNGYILWPYRMAQIDDNATQHTSKLSPSLRES